MGTSKRLQGKRALVTGAGTGIGMGIAIEFAREGAVVALHYAHSSKGAEATVAEISKMGGKAKAFQADFDNVDSVKAMGQKAVKFLGGLDILVNNAGITMNRPFEKVTLEQFDTLFHVNVRGQFFLTQSLVPDLAKDGGGVVINISSGHAFGGLREHSVYAGTKGAIVSYTRELSVELCKKGIRVCGLSPGWVRNENQEKVQGEDFDWDKAGLSLPSGFIATPADIGPSAVFLASDDARYIYGHTLVVDGGQLAILPATGDFRQPMDIQFGQGYVSGLG
jgi:NAD(P)-dependent dehydrogenase (short-subunit alcohol dehydrogenase family)